MLMQLVRLYQGGEVVRMSKRTGQYVTLQELIEDVGKDAARYFFIMRNPDSHLDLPQCIVLFVGHAFFGQQIYNLLNRTAFMQRGFAEPRRCIGRLPGQFAQNGWIRCHQGVLH